MTKVKRIADFLEKLAVGSVIVGLFYAQLIGYFYGAVFLLVSLYLTKGE